MNEAVHGGTNRKLPKRILAIVLVAIIALVGIYAPSITDVLVNGLVVRNSRKFLGHFKYGTVVTHNFDIWNVSLRAVEIGLVEPGCSCSVASVSNYKILPLRKSTITMKVKTGDLGPGKVIKGIRINMMDGRSIDTCYVNFIIDRPSEKLPEK